MHRYTSRVTRTLARRSRTPTTLSVAPHVDNILAKYFDELRFGRAFIFPRSSAAYIPNLRLPPLAVVVSPSKSRVIHDLALSVSPRPNSVNTDTDSAQALPVERGRVLRYAIWRILYLRRRFGPRARIVLTKIDVPKVVHHMSVQWTRAPVFGYSLRKWVVSDRRLQFRWRISPGGFCLFSAALEHAHRHPSYDDAVVMELGNTVSQHIKVLIHRERPTAPSRLLSACRVPGRQGGGRRGWSFVRYYVDDGRLVKMQWWSDGRCCRRASAFLASDHFRLFRTTSPRDPALPSSHKMSSWDTVLCVVGWDIDTVAMIT